MSTGSAPTYLEATRSPAPARRSPLGFLAGLIAGASGTYAAKPQTVEIPPPPPVVDGAWRCVQAGQVDPATGKAPEWCTLVQSPDAGER